MILSGNEAAELAVAALKLQFERIGELLREIEDGRWWPDDRAGDEDAAHVVAQADCIDACVTEIARIFTTMRD